MPNTHFVADAAAAADGADLVMTDVCVSMGDTNGEKRRQDFAAYMVDDTVMAAAAKDAIFMHCLPAHRGEEVSSSVIDGEQSAVWRQAENRLHAQKRCWNICFHRRRRERKNNKVVLAYSGGLDTTVILLWLRETYGCEVVTFTADIGQGEEITPAKAKAEKIGVKEIFIEDLRDTSLPTTSGRCCAPMRCMNTNTC